MLGKLFGSNARVKILKLFLTNPGKSFYIRQLARDLSLQINSVRRELENLEKFGLLVSGDDIPKDIEAELYPDNLLAQEMEKEKKIQSKNSKKKSELSQKNEKKFFKVNKDFILFEELKALILKAQVLYEDDFVTKMKKIGSIKLLLMTGFFVNNLFSPVDLLIVGKINKVKLVELITDLEKELGREINFTFMDAKEFKYRRDVTDVFLYEILEGKKLIVLDEYGI